MDRVLHLILSAIAVVFLLIGVGWLMVPGVVAPQLGMTLLEGVGLSTQVGDLASFFLTLGGCVIFAVRTGNPAWFYAAAMLLGFAAFGRVVAWGVHDAALAYTMIAFEGTVAGLLLLAARRSVNRKFAAARDSGKFS